MLAKRRLGPLEFVFTHRSKSLEKAGKESRINLSSWRFVPSFSISSQQVAIFNPLFILLDQRSHLFAGQRLEKWQIIG